MEAIRSFFVNYWAFSQWYLIGIGVVYLVILLPFRQPGKAGAFLVVGLYITLTAYFLTTSAYKDMGLDKEWALGVVIVLGLALCGLMYYAYFIRSE